MDSLIFIVVVVAFLVVLAVVLVLARRDRAQIQAQAQASVEKLAAQQSELTGRLQQMAEAQAISQANITETLQARLDAVGDRLGHGLDQHTEKTGKAMSDLHARLAVIDTAQKNLTDLSQQMVGLQDILSNKQARGAFGEIQLQDLVTAALPPTAYEFQATLSNNKRADCLLRLPNPPGSIVIDSKFPLESFEALRNAETEAEKVQAARAFATDVGRHVKAIAEKYIVQGETAESALMFLPSEAVYAELHASHRNVVVDSFRRRVWIVSPTTLMATLNTVRAILKDARMREQAGVIQQEVHKLLDDVTRLDGRVENLQKHFGQASRDIDQIRTSTGKITRKAEKIDAIQLGADQPADDLAPALPATDDENEHEDDA